MHGQPVANKHYVFRSNSVVSHEAAEVEAVVFQIIAIDIACTSSEVLLPNTPQGKI